VNSAMGQLNQITQQNASASEELAATAEEMNGQASILQELMSFFTIAGSKEKGRQPVTSQTATKRTIASKTPIVHVALGAANKKGNGTMGINEADFAHF